MNSNRSLGLRKKAGFTMIELLVSIATLMLIVGGGLASYLSFNDKQQLIVAAKELKTYIRSAQSKARAGDKPEGCDVLRGYKVSLPVDSSNVQIFGVCDNGDVLRSEHTINSNVSSREAIEIIFATLKGGVSGYGDIILENDSGLVYSFYVGAGGNISGGGIGEPSEQNENDTNYNNDPIASPKVSPDINDDPAPSPTPKVTPSPTPSPTPEGEQEKDDQDSDQTDIGDDTQNDLIPFDDCSYQDFYDGLCDVPADYSIWDFLYERYLKGGF